MTTESTPLDPRPLKTAETQAKPALDLYLEAPMEGAGIWASLDALLKRPGRLLFALRNDSASGVVGAWL